MKLSITLFIIFSFFFSLTGQVTFERTYPTNASERPTEGKSVRQLPGGQYLMLSSVTLEDGSNLANVSRLDRKGNVLWSLDYDFGDSAYVANDLTLLGGDSFAITVSRQDSFFSAMVLLADAGGVPVWTRALESVDTTTDLFYNQSVLVAGQGGSIGAFGLDKGFNGIISAALIDRDGNLIWGRDFRADDPGVEVSFQRGAAATPDSGFILTGTVEVASGDRDLYLLKLANDGTLQWVRRYGYELRDDQVFQEDHGVTVIPSIDGGYLVAGYALAEPASPPPALISEGILIKTDAVGNTQWIKKVAFPNEDLLVSLRGLVQLEDSSFTVSGVSTLASIDTSFAFALNISPDGTVNWKEQYTLFVPQKDRYVLPIHKTVSTGDGGIAIIGTVLETDGDKVEPYLVKTDSTGRSFCSTPIDSQIVFADTFPSSNLNFVSGLIDSVMSRTVTETPFSRWSIPVLNLEQPPPFCEGEPIEVTLDATLLGGVFYEWSTGDTTRVITVTETGQYSVTVTVGDRICFELCDTVVISEIGPPEVSVTVTDDEVCLTGNFVLVANVTGAQELLWSTGDTEPFIAVPQGEYTLTATNQCGSTQVFVPTGPPTGAPPVAAIIVIDSTFCTDGVFGLRAGVLNAVSFEWSTGSADTMINVEPGQYSLTATNFCGVTTSDVALERLTDCPPCVQVPNAFTPNNDRNNDTFGPIVNCNTILNYEFRIFNRWGELVFETTDPSEQWDGTQNGEDAPMDVYVYIVSYNDGVNDLKDNGDVTLIR